MLNLPLISIRRPVFALMLNVALVVLGLVSLTRLNVDLNPDVEFPFVTVTTILEGASPETIETEVTDVLEEQINTIEGIRELSSVSSEGSPRSSSSSKTGYDIDVKAQHVRGKMAPVRAELPLDIKDPVVTQIDPDATPILSIMLGGPVSVRELSELAENMVKGSAGTPARRRQHRDHRLAPPRGADLARSGPARRLRALDRTMSAPPCCWRTPRPPAAASRGASGSGR